MQKYTLGFAFDNAATQVVLIEKKRPKWQLGKLNGVGGHLEEDDKSLAVGMQREFWEETGVVVPAEKWQAFAALQGKGWHVRCFRVFDDAVLQCLTKTDEPVMLMPVESLPGVAKALIPNLQYLIPLALDKEHVGVPLFHYGK
jgi:8-oxo-dGTP pyrophosphatase MutT (NUDIX family)